MSNALSNIVKVALIVAATVITLAEPAAQNGAAQEQPKLPGKPEPGVHPLSLAGRALNSDGKPIEGATIFIVSTNGIDRALGKTTTDKEGRYSFRDIPLPVPVRENKEFFSSANFQVFGRAPGLSVAWRGMKTLCLDPRFERNAKTSETGFFPEEKIELDLEFETPHPVAGRFLDEHGKPVAGVFVRLAHCDYLDVAGRESHVNYREFWSLSQAASVMPEEVVATSDAEGKFELKSMPPERICWLLINHPDYANSSVYVATSGRGVTEHDKHPVVALPLEMTLRSTRKVPVQVVFADTEKPAAGIRVVASQMRASGDSAYGTSDKDGKVLLRLPPGTYKLNGDPTKTMDYVRTRQDLEVAEKPDEQPAVLKIDPGCVLILKAVDAKTGKGIAGVSFWYEMTEPRNARTGVQSSTVWVDHPKTNDEGELRAVVYPGKRRYGVGFNPLPKGYRVANPQHQSQGVELNLTAEEAVTVEFDLVRDLAEEK